MFEAGKPGPGPNPNLVGETITGDTPFEIPPDAMGPAMNALKSEKQRRFAYLMGCGVLNAKQAACDAGYASSWDGLGQEAYRMRNSPKIAAAIQEVARRVLMNAAPIVIKELLKIVTNEKHPKQLEACAMVLNRTGYGEKSEHLLTVEHKDDSRLVELAQRFADEFKLDPQKLIGRLEGEERKHPLDRGRGVAVDAEGMVYAKSHLGKWILRPPGEQHDASRETPVDPAGQDVDQKM